MPHVETGGPALSLRISTEVESCLDRVLELDPPDRESWLAELGKQQPDVAQDVRALLAEIEALNTAGFLLGSSPGTPSDISGVVAGDRIGPYSLVREIGQGGMSSVWLARRNDGQFKREVALKLPVLGPRMQLEHFIRERDLLASLTHPNIARLYDAGVTESGQPYLGMEYVAGTTLTQSCDERRLTLSERLTLFVQVLHTVQFAHAELIIHRDLKPSNILVTPEGRVVLVDFGIGKLLTGDGTDETHLTQLSGRAFTPYYASPEQITGQTLGTASDIYSLGVILYELLTGSRPYRPSHDSRAALEESIVRADVRRPSQVALSMQTASARSTTPHSLARALAGDLDNIVLKALKKNPADRYASASAFAQDVTNYLEKLPVNARPDSTWYRVSRFTARHRIPVIAASVAASALLAGAALAMWQARTASIARDQAVALASRNAAVTEFLGTLITQAAEGGKPVTVTEMLARSERLALADTSSDPENRAAVLRVIGERFGALGNDEAAERLFEKGLSLLRNSHDSSLRAELQCQHAITLANLGQRTAAVKIIERELQHLDSDPRIASYCLFFRSDIAASENQAGLALHFAKQALERYHLAPPVVAGEEGLFLDEVAFAYYLNGMNRESDQYYRQAVQKYVQVGREASVNAITIRNNWAVVLNGVGAPKRALEIYDSTLRLVAEHYQDEAPPPYLFGNRARTLEAIGRYEDSRAAYQMALQIAEERRIMRTQAQALAGLASLAQEQGDRSGAYEYLRRFSAVITDAVPRDSPERDWLAIVQARLDMNAGNFASASTGFAQAIRNPRSAPGMAARLGKSEAELRAGNVTAAEKEARLALATATAMQGDMPYSNFTGLSWLALGRALLQLGKSDEARQALENAVAHLSNTVDDGHPALAEARDLLKAFSS